MKDLKLNPYVIQDISSCLEHLKPYGIMYESPSVYFPNVSRVDEVDFQVWKDYLAFDITIAKTSFSINVPIKSTVSLDDNTIDFQFPNGDFLVIGLDKEIKTLDWLNIFHRKDIFKESLKRIHGFDKENQYLLGLTVATNERVLEYTLEEDGLEVDWDYINKVLSELDYAIERKFAKEIGHVAVEEFHDDEGYHCTFWVRYDDVKAMKYLNNLHYVDNYHYGEFTSKLVDVDEICGNEIDKLEKKYDADILEDLRECVSVWIEVPNKIA